MRFLCWYVGLNDEKNIKKTKFTQLPPPSLRYRVGGRPEVDKFLAVGKQLSADIDDSLKKIGRNLDSFENVLDFGCGCARTLIWFSDRKPNFFGTDIDSESIAWSKKHLNFATFSVNNALPPLEYSDGQFDLIYAISVFTHLNEEYQFRWMSELRRVLRQNGILIATFHATGSWKDLAPQHLAKLQKDGFVYLVRNDRKGILPTWYQTAYHTKEYIMDKFGQNFKVLAYLEKGLKNFQDLVVLQKS